jgi:hypothetical protein
MVTETLFAQRARDISSKARCCGAEDTSVFGLDRPCVGFD